MKVLMTKMVTNYNESKQVMVCDIAYDKPVHIVYKSKDDMISEIYLDNPKYNLLELDYNKDRIVVSGYESEFTLTKLTKHKLFLYNNDEEVLIEIHLGG